MGLAPELARTEMVLSKECFGSPNSNREHFLTWRRAGVLVRLRRHDLAEYDELESIAWVWQSVDATFGKVALTRTDRGKAGTKRSLLADGREIPSSVVDEASARSLFVGLRSSL